MTSPWLRFATRFSKACSGSSAAVLGGSTLIALTTITIFDEELDRHKPDFFNRNYKAQFETKYASLAKLTENARRYHFPEKSSVSYLDTNCVSSNDPCEDQNAFFIDKQNGAVHLGVFDGHVGPQAARFVSRFLLREIAESIKTATSAEKFVEHVAKAYAATESALGNEARQIAEGRAKDGKASWTTLERLHPPFDVLDAAAAYKAPMTGSCAVSVSVFSQPRRAIAAHLGDCRAVLGTYDAKQGVWLATVLTNDHTGFSESEIQRVNSEHPASESGHIITGDQGRLLGIAISRSFGDVFLKWPMHLQNDLWAYRDRKLNPKLLTPPYLSSEPDVTQIDLADASQKQFVILASDGLWDRLTSEEAVALVAAKLENQTGFVPKAAILDRAKYDERSIQSKSLRKESVLHRVNNFVFQDDNIATHLIRNALGAQDVLVDKLLRLSAPESRACRDDITVQVAVLQ